MKEHFTRKHKGFTLVELLIVIVVIGILSAMMMLSSSEAVSSAKATAIISDLRNLKTAALAYFADNPDEYITKPGGQGTQIKYDTQKNVWKEIMNYLNGEDFPNQKSYALLTDKTEGSAWYVQCSISGINPIVTGTEQAAVKKKLAGRAKSLGLLADRYAASATNKQSYGEGKDNGYVYMLVQ